jgi:hypothetical protein
MTAVPVISSYSRPKTASRERSLRIESAIGYTIGSAALVRTSRCLCSHSRSNTNCLRGSFLMHSYAYRPHKIHNECLSVCIPPSCTSQALNTKVEVRSCKKLEPNTLLPIFMHLITLPDLRKQHHSLVPPHLLLLPDISLLLQPSSQEYLVSRILLDPLIQHAAPSRLYSRSFWRKIVHVLEQDIVSSTDPVCSRNGLGYKLTIRRI